MSKKIKITEQQLAIITNYINQTNINEGLINENKDIVFGIANLMGVNLSGLNKEIGENALNNPKKLKKIGNLLSGNQIEYVVSKMEEMGLKDPMSLIYKNSDKIMDNYGKYAEKHGLNPKLQLYIGEDFD